MMKKRNYSIKKYITTTSLDMIGILWQPPEFSRNLILQKKTLKFLIEMATSSRIIRNFAK